MAKSPYPDKIHPATKRFILLTSAMVNAGFKDIAMQGIPPEQWRHWSTSCVRFDTDEARAAYSMKVKTIFEEWVRVRNQLFTRQLDFFSLWEGAKGP